MWNFGSHHEWKRPYCGTRIKDINAKVIKQRSQLFTILRDRNIKVNSSSNYDLQIKRLENKYVYTADFSQILPGSERDVRILRDNNISGNLVSFEIKSKEHPDLLFSSGEDFNLITYHFFSLNLSHYSTITIRD